MPALRPASMSDDVIDSLLSRLLGLEGREDSQVGRIAIDVARDIIEERIEPDADLNSFDLARRFATSRTPVREALLVLQKDGLVEVPPRRRARAAMFSRQDIHEIYELRAELYALVARRIVENADDAAVATLADRLPAMERAAAEADHDAFFWQVVLFHEQASQICGNQTLKRSIDGLGLRVLQLRHVGMARGWRVDRSLSDHTRLVDAVRERDAELAGALNRALVLAGLRGLDALMDEGAIPRRHL